MTTAAIRRRLDKLEGVIEAPPIATVDERDAATLRALISAAVRWRSALASPGATDLMQFLRGVLARAEAAELTDADLALLASLPTSDTESVELVRVVLGVESRF